MNVLIIERPGAFRDALVSAVRARGAAVSASDGALEALGKLRELAPRVVVVSDASGPPDVASTARLVRRQLGDVPVYHLHDPSAGASAPDTRPLSRSDDVDALARALIDGGSGGEAVVEASVPATSPREEEPIDELVELASEPPKAAARPAPPIAPPPIAPPPIAPPPPIAALPPAAAPAPAAVAAAAPVPAPAHDDSNADAALLAAVEPLVHQGRWQEVIELVAKREPDPQRLSPRAALLFAVALKEAPAGGPGTRPTVDPDLLGVRAVAALLHVDGQSTTALMIAKRVLRRRPLEWQREPPRRVSIVLTLIALALGAAAGLAFSQHLIRLLFG